MKPTNGCDTEVDVFEDVDEPHAAINMAVPRSKEPALTLLHAPLDDPIQLPFLL
jgi:hypothetical protein